MTHLISAKQGTDAEPTQDEPIALASSGGETNAIDVAGP
jgi:hypothetical protein